ncbi:MAG: hypothetical protein ABIE07_02235 [Candidatus Zixiibacteriota bacterium]
MGEKKKNNSLNKTDSGYEKRDVNILKVLGYGAGLIAVLVIILIFLFDYYFATREELVYEMELKPISAELRELRAQEAELLSSYGLIDEKNEVYRIPIEAAMKLMADSIYSAKTDKGR